MVPHATDRTVSQGMYMSALYEGKLTNISGEEVTILVSKRDKSGVSFQVKLDSSKTHATGSVVCPCGYTHALGIPCYHAAFCLIHLRLIFEAFNMKTKDADGKLSYDSLPKFAFILTTWFHTNWHVDTYMAQYEFPIAVPTLSIHCAQYQLYPPHQRLQAGRQKKNRIKSSKEFLRQIAQKKDARENDTSSVTTIASISKVGLVCFTHEFCWDLIIVFPIFN